MPLGIGELTNLQTLPKIIMGGDDGFAITELKKLENLHGKMSIEGLDKVKDADTNTNLSLKSITELELIWGNVFDGSRNEATEKKVLGELKPHNDKLQKLSIMSYGGAEFPNWVGHPSFLHLVHVLINRCRNCASLPSLAQLPSLKKLSIEDMDEVKVVESNSLGTGDAFPSLEILQFKNMTGWEVWSTGSGIVFPRLRELLIIRCPNLVEVSFKLIPSLRVLSIIGCGYGVLRSLVCEDSAITKLNIGEISGLTDRAWKGVMMNLRAVQELRVDGCNEIRYLWESEAEASKVFVNLRKLVVGYCSKLVSLGEKEDDDGGSKILASFRTLDVYNCESMKHCICGNGIERLSISWCMSMTYVLCGNNVESLHISICSSLTSVSFPTTTSRGNDQKLNLKSLSIIGCEKLFTIKELVGGGENINTKSTKMEILEYVYIEGWKNLKSINELSYSIHLTKLYISNCKSLESLPDREFLNLTSLKRLIIIDCPSMDACFPRGNWPPKLSTLEIGELKKPIWKWGNQNFPTSLVHLRLVGTGDDEESNTNINQLSNLIPPSLTSLQLWEFEKLETISTGLQHLTSLQHLSIRYCQNIKDLPETLLASLLSLEINGCPKLKERGSHYRPLISHIPCITIRDY